MRNAALLALGFVFIYEVIERRRIRKIWSADYVRTIR